MDRDLQECTIHSYPHAFISRADEPILVTTLNDKRCRQLIDMYLAYRPRNSFQGLPPITDEGCLKWAQHMIGHGVNLVALGNHKVLSMKGASELNDKMRALGFEVYDPDMSMFTLGGGGVHCLCQALCRDRIGD